MNVGQLCTRIVRTATRSEPVADAARRMRDEGVGTLVVVDLDQRGVGMITDRDITVRCVAEGRDPAHTRVREVMTTPVRSVPESAGIDEVVEAMVAARVRRLVVVDRAGAPVGLISLDDVVEQIFEEGADLSRLLQLQAPV